MLSKKLIFALQDRANRNIADNYLKLLRYFKDIITVKFGDGNQGGFKDLNLKVWDACYSEESLSDSKDDSGYSIYNIHTTFDKKLFTVTILAKDTVDVKDGMRVFHDVYILEFHCDIRIDEVRSIF